MDGEGAFQAGGIATGVFLLATGGFVLTTRLIAGRRRNIFLEGLMGPVRIGTPCRVVSGRALLPGTVALTATGLVWEAVAGEKGQFTFEEIQRLETDEKLEARRGFRRFLRNKVIRVTPVSGAAREFVVSPGHAWEWRQALGEWVARRGKVG
jgi:hypothetical protein